jgi:hypothetical protein
MALTVPPAFVSADIPSSWEVRGGTIVALPSTSTKAVPSAYKVKDVCGSDAYVKGGHSISIAKLVNCVPILLATVSIRATFSLDTTEANMKELINYVRDELTPALAAA